MNNLVGKATGHHTTSGASFACGVATYRPNTHGKRLSPAELKAEQVPTIKSIQRASEVIKNILGETFWKNFYSTDRTLGKNANDTVCVGAVTGQIGKRSGVVGRIREINGTNTAELHVDHFH